MGIILSILIWILKGIGIILAILLFLMLLILFTPIRYQLQLKKDSTLQFSGRISWLLSFLRIQYDYDAENKELSIRILGIRINHSKTEEAKPNITPTVKKDRNPEIMPEIKPEFVSEGRIEGKLQVKPEISEIKPEEKRKEKKPEIKSESLQAKNSSTNGKHTKRRKPKIKKTKMKEPSKAKQLLQKILDFKQFLQDNPKIFRHTKKWIFKILKSVFPRSYRGRLAFGMENPAHTGYLLSLFYLFYRKKYGKIIVLPDFEKAFWDADIKIKGRVIPAVLLYYGFRLLIDRRIRRFIQFLKQKNNSKIHVNTT